MELKNWIWFFAYLYVVSGGAIRQIHPDFGLTAIELIEKYGYPIEVHKIHTEDGYILETHRIPHGKNNKYSGPKQPVLFVAGVLCGSADFVNMGPKNSLGFILADAGYDVWLANYRGNTWSRVHETLNADTNEKEFFDYSFQEIGGYDVPANIDYILNVTQQPNLFYIGHSQGTTSFFAMVAEKPEYNNKIRLMTALAPVAYLTNIDNILLNILKENIDFFYNLFEKTETYEILPHSPLITIMSQVLCNDDSFFQPFCAEIIYLLAGRSTNFDETNIPVITSNTPAGSSARIYLHYAQLAIADAFQHYNFGKTINLEKYGQETPPKYDLGKVKSPIAIYYADQDTLSTVANVDRLIAELPNVVTKKFIKGYSHLDYLWANNSVSMLYNDIVQEIKNYS